MAVVETWGRIDGVECAPIKQHADDYWFPIPEALSTGQVVAEFWARDDHGNVGYKAAVLELFEGTVKCIRHLNRYGSCIMRPIVRPSVATLSTRAFVDMLPTYRMDVVAIEGRPVLMMLPHHCMQMEV